MNTWNPSKKSALSSLETRAIRVAAPRGVRQPKDLSPEAAALADRALQRIVDVMEEQVHSKRAKGVLSAAIEIREEICGPKTQKIAIEGTLEQILSASLAVPIQSPEPSAGSLPPPQDPEIVPPLADELSLPDPEGEPIA